MPTRSPRASRPSSDRKSTRLNSSHVAISYAVFCLKKKTADAEMCATGLVGQPDTAPPCPATLWTTSEKLAHATVAETDRQLTLLRTFFFNDIASRDFCTVSLPAALPV